MLKKKVLKRLKLKVKVKNPREQKGAITPESVRLSGRGVIRIKQPEKE